MKKTTVFLIIIYLIIFIAAAWWFYGRYFRDLIVPEKNTVTVSFTPNKTIFYTIENNLYLLNADNLNKSLNETGTIRLQSTGQVQTVSLDQTKQFIVYDSITPLNSSEGSAIWKVSLSDNHSEKLFSQQSSGLENYDNFRNPQMSMTGNHMAFIASHDSTDDIFIWNILTNNLMNLTSQSVKSKIVSLTWSSIELKVYYSSYDNANSSINLIDLEKNNQLITTSPGQITRMYALQDRLILTNKDNSSTDNLAYILYSKNNVVSPITDLKTPKTVKKFDVSASGKKVVYQVEDSSLKTNDLYIANIDGSNLLQLTTDGKSKFGVFSPASDKIAYWVENSGIFTMGITKINPQKILNNDKTINNLALWR